MHTCRSLEPKGAYGAVCDGGGEGAGQAGEATPGERVDGRKLHKDGGVGEEGRIAMEMERADDLLIPPLNFGRVCRGVYRSGYPGKKNFTFLKKLKLHTVLNLSEHEYPAETLELLSENQVKWTHMPMVGNREPMQSTDEALLCKALVQVLQATADRPLLIHCTKGTHRTGCVVGCLRKLEKWSLTSIFDEYQRYAGTKAPHLDQQFIEFFAPTEQHRVMARKRQLFDS
jgi:tyrosine-protein phosphatase SIW14